MDFKHQSKSFHRGFEIHNKWVFSENMYAGVVHLGVNTTPILSNN